MPNQPATPPRRRHLAASLFVLATGGLAGHLAADELALPPSATDVATAAITADYLRAGVGFLADDLLEGRLPGTRGDALTRAYLVRQLEGLGLAPAFGTSYEQPVALVGITAELPPTWTFRGPKGQVDAGSLEEYVAASGLQAEVTDLAASDLVFVGYGIEAPEYGWDDFKGTDLRGKVLLMLNNDPDWDDELFAGNRRLYYGRWTYKYESAARQGAAGAIIIHTPASAGYGWPVVRNSWGGTQFELPAGDEPRIRVKGWLTEDVARRVLALGDHPLEQLVAAARSRDFRPVALGIETSLRFPNRLERVTSANVGAVLSGRDRARRAEMVIYTAHHDHLGVGEPDPDGDAIYNGARDNAAGVAQVLGVARAFAHLPVAERPHRSVMFLLVAGEEQGLLGAEYFAANPPLPAGRIAANVNLDGPGIWGRTRDVTYVGLGKSSLDTVIRAAAARQGREVRGDQFPDKGFFYRSDQLAFAKRGVPALYIDNGTELVGRSVEESKELIATWERDHYHQPSDEVDARWDFAGLVEDAQLAFTCGLAIANAEAMPRWNPGDEFEAARRAALAEIAAAGGGQR